MIQNPIKQPHHQKLENKKGKTHQRMRGLRIRLLSKEKTKICHMKFIHLIMIMKKPGSQEELASTAYLILK